MLGLRPGIRMNIVSDKLEIINTNQEKRIKTPVRIENIK